MIFAHTKDQHLDNLQRLSFKAKKEIGVVNMDFLIWQKTPLVPPPSPPPPTLASIDIDEKVKKNLSSKVQLSRCVIVMHPEFILLLCYVTTHWLGRIIWKITTRLVLTHITSKYFFLIYFFNLSLYIIYVDLK